MSIQEPIVRYLGGEAGHRSFFGGTHSRARVGFLGLFIVLGLVLTPFLGWPGILIGGVGCVATLVLTARTHRGSILDRHTKRSRWKKRVAAGADAYSPYEVARWDQLEQALADARAVGRRGRTLAWQVQRELTAMRAMPDGADGMGWLQMGHREPGIQWHAPLGQRPYLAVVFHVTGQLNGVTSTASMNQSADAWGRFLASRAAPSSLVSEVSTLTRVLPADSAIQELWVSTGLDPAISPDHAAVRSYAEVLRRNGMDAMVQRHSFTLTWPITPAFEDAAAKYGEGRDGWRQLMRQEIAATVRGLREARMGEVSVLTARQTAAQILHQQNPSRPIDFVEDVHPARLGVASHDEFSAHVVDAVDGVRDATGPDTAAVEWWHRTCAIRGENMTIAPRTQLWALDVLVGSDLAFIRSISFTMRLVPAAEAKNAAKQDLTRDRAAQLADAEAGRLVDTDASVAMTAAARRRADLTAGSHHHGVEWVGYITISTRSRDELARASRQLADVCATGLGIERLEWQDSYQSAASGMTWPIGRGLAEPRSSFSTSMYNRLAGRSAREEIS